VPVAVKVAPDMDSQDINDFCDTAKELSIDAIIATNTTLSRPHWSQKSANRFKKHHSKSLKHENGNGRLRYFQYKNHDALVSTLETGAEVIYFDHHFPGEIPEAENLDAHIDTDAETCTGLLVNKYLDGAHLRWAVTAAYGDNLHKAAQAAAAPLKLSQEELAQLEELGTLLNYNGYGAH